MRIAVDVTPLAGERTGIGLFVNELVNGLAQQAATDRDLELVGLAMTARGRDSILKTLPPGIPLSRPAPARLLRETWSRSDFPPVEILTGSVDVVHGTNYVVPPSRRAATLVTIADLGAWHSPDRVHPSSLAYPALVQRALDRGAHVHAMSEYVASEIRADLGVRADRVHTIPIGIGRSVEGDHDRGKKMIGSRPYILAVGTIEPRKNFPVLVQTLALLSDEYPDLVLAIAGGKGWGEDALDEAISVAGASGRVVKLGFVSDQQKADLYAGAELLVSAAGYEGFGVVPLEAMAAALPVVAVAGGSIPEVCGDAARLVSTADPDHLAQAIQEILSDARLRASMVERGLVQVSTFTWQSTVTAMLGLYRDLVSA